MRGLRDTPSVRNTGRRIRFYDHRRNLVRLEFPWAERWYEDLCARNGCQGLGQVITSLTGLNNSIGPIPRDCPKWPSGNDISLRSCPPYLYSWIFGQLFGPLFVCQITGHYPPAAIVNFIGSSSTKWFSYWMISVPILSRISYPNRRVQFIVYHIISVVLTSVLNYWWRSENTTAVCQVAIKGDINTLRCVQQCEISSALAM